MNQHKVAIFVIVLLICVVLYLQMYQYREGYESYRNPWVMQQVHPYDRTLGAGGPKVPYIPNGYYYQVERQEDIPAKYLKQLDITPTMQYMNPPRGPIFSEGFTQLNNMYLDTKGYP